MLRRIPAVMSVLGCKESAWLNPEEYVGQGISYAEKLAYFRELSQLLSKISHNPGNESPLCIQTASRPDSCCRGSLAATWKCGIGKSLHHLQSADRTMTAGHKTHLVAPPLPRKRQRSPCRSLFAGESRPPQPSCRHFKLVTGPTQDEGAYCPGPERAGRAAWR